MTRKGVLGLILGAALVIVVIAGYHLGVNRGHALLGFVTLTVVSGMTLALVDPPRRRAGHALRRDHLPRLAQAVEGAR
ncbi:MAG: hypothetical protein ACYSU0_09085 [Planctomycetota bacterium]|jgi:hypothetical protein